MPQGLPGVLQLADLAILHAALALALGTFASGRWLSAAHSGWGRATLAQAVRARRWALVVGALAVALALWLQAAIMSETSLAEAWPAVEVLVRRTHYGHVVLVGFAAWLVLGVAGWRSPGAGRGRAWLAAAALLVFAWSRSAVSHAANAGDWSPDVAVDVLHVLATSLWVGVVWLGAIVDVPMTLATARDRADASAWVSSLSATATGCLAAVLATGVFKVWRAVGDWHAFPGSDYGSILFLKLALVAVAMALGGYNRFRVLPGLLAGLRGPGAPAHGAAWRGRLLAVLRIEAAVLGLVLVAAALLASTEPAG